MTDPIPINVAAVEARSAQAEARQLLATQVLSNARFQEDVDEGFNPAAVERQQGRLGRFRTLENRRKTPDESKKIQAVEAKAEEDLAQSFHKRNEEIKPDRLRELRRDLGPNSTAEEVLEEVMSRFEDPTLADEVLDYLERTTDGSLNISVRNARQILQGTKGREIIAGRNVDAAAKFFHKKGLGESPTQLRDLYRDITGNPRDHNTLFSELSAKYTFDQLKLVVAFLLKGLGFDLKSKGPSIQKQELMRLMTETRNLQSILWVFLFFKSRGKLMRSMFAQYGVPPKSFSFEVLAKEFIKLVEEKYPSVMKLMKDTDKLGFDDIDKVIVLTQYRDAIRGLSPRLYRTLKHRQDLLLVIIEALEDLEEEEEEENVKVPKSGKKPS